MFRLDGKHIYTWDHLFILLSLDQFGVFSDDVHFPLVHHLKSIQEISKDFVREFYRTGSHAFSLGKVSETTRNLFRDTFETLLQQIGRENTVSFCNWGNALDMDEPIEETLIKFWDLLIDKLDTDSPVLSEDSLLIVQAFTVRYRFELNGVFSALNIIEKLPKSKEDLEFYRIYNQGDSRDVELSNVLIKGSPLEYLEGVITFVKIRELLCRIRRVLSKNEIYSLLDWLGIP